MIYSIDLGFIKHVQASVGGTCPMQRRSWVTTPVPTCYCAQRT